MTDKRKSGGLAGVVAGRTAISSVGKEDVGLAYRGYRIEELADPEVERFAISIAHQVIANEDKLIENFAQNRAAAVRLKPLREHQIISDGFAIDADRGPNIA